MAHVVLIGAGGQGRVVLKELFRCPEWQLAGVIDPLLAKGSTFHGAPVLGSDEVIPELPRMGIGYGIIGVGSVGEPCAGKRGLG